MGTNVWRVSQLPQCPPLCWHRPACGNDTDRGVEVSNRLQLLKGCEVKKTSELDIKGTVVRVVKINGEDFVCLTDMAKLKSEDAQ